MKKRMVWLLGCVLVLTGVLWYMGGSGSASYEDGNGDGEETLPPPEPTVEELLMEQIEEMSLEEKVGQMFLIRCPQTGAAEDVETYLPGGMIYFAQDFKEKTPEQAAADIDACQQASFACTGLPLLTAVDEEGGDVNRVSWYTQYRSQPFASPQKLYAEGGWDLILSDTVEKCQLLSSLGLNVNMAPVCDIAADPSAYIYSRTFGGDAEHTAEYVRRVVSAMCGEHMGSVLKHFPGYGGNSDTHLGFSVDSRPYSEFQTSDLKPFEAGIEAGAGCVLVSHNIVTCMDETYPASLSPEVHRVLREELGFDGVIMTDDLVMSAIVSQYGTEEAAVLAVKAGNDMICCSEYSIQIPAVTEAVRAGSISESSIDASVLRVLLWKHSLGLLKL